MVRGDEMGVWGIEFGEREDDDSVRVRGVVPGTAAANSRPSLREDDVIVSVNGKMTRHLGFDALLRLFAREVKGTRLEMIAERAVRLSPAEEPDDDVSTRRSEEKTTSRTRSRRLSFRSSKGAVDKEWSALEEYFVEVVPQRVYAVRGGDSLERLAGLASKNFGHGTDMVFGSSSASPRRAHTRLARCWDLADPENTQTEDTSRVLRVAVFGPRERGVLDKRTLSRVDGRVPGLRELIAVGAAVGAWLSLDGEHVAFIGDSSGARLRVAMACVALLRIGGLVDPHCAAAMTDSSLEAYEDFLKKASLETALPLASLPPSFKRALSHLDASVACRDAPNANALRLVRVEASGVFDFQVRVEVRHATPTTFSFENDGILRLPPRSSAVASKQQTFLLMADLGAILFDDFAVTLVNHTDNDPVLRFASNTAFLGPGKVSLPKRALDVFPRWREKLPSDFALIFHLGIDNRSQQKKASPLVPHDRKAILALGLEVLASNSNPRVVAQNNKTPIPVVNVHNKTPPVKPPTSSGRRRRLFS